MGKEVKLSASDISEKWARRAKQAIPDAQAGVARVTENPAEKAIAKKDKMLANVQKAILDGRWEAGLKKVTLGGWKEKTIAKIGERLAGGVDAAAGKRQEFDSWLVDRLNKKLPEIHNMPDLTLEDGIARMTAQVRHMAEKPYKGN